jgi:hypothetical protein
MKTISTILVHGPEDGLKVDFEIADGHICEHLFVKYNEKYDAIYERILVNEKEVYIFSQWIKSERNTKGKKQ